MDECCRGDDRIPKRCWIGDVQRGRTPGDRPIDGKHTLVKRYGDTLVEPAAQDLIGNSPKRRSRRGWSGREAPQQYRMRLSGEGRLDAPGPRVCANVPPGLDSSRQATSAPGVYAMVETSLH